MHSSYALSNKVLKAVYGLNDDRLRPSLQSQGADAYAAKVEFPAEAEALDKTVIVGSMNPQVTLDQVSCQLSLWLLDTIIRSVNFAVVSIANEHMRETI